MKTGGRLLAILIISFVSSSAGAKVTLTLADCIGLANQFNPTLKSKESRVDEAAGSGPDSSRRLSAQSPGGCLAAAVGYARSPGINVAGSVIPHPAGHQFHERLFPETHVTLDQTIYDFGRTQYSYGAAKAGRDAASSQLELGRQDLALGVVEVFFGALLTQKRLEVARASKRSLDEYYRTVSNMYEQEVVNRNDLLVADVSRSQAKLKVTQAEQNLEVARVRFQNVVGTSPDSLDHGAFVHRPFDPGLGSLVEEARDERAELVVNDRMQAVAQAQSKAAASQYLPDLYVRGEASYKRDDILLHKDQYSFTVGLRWPFFDGLAADGQRRSAEARRQSLAFQKEALGDTIGLQVTKSYNDLKLSDEAIAVERKNKAQAAENLRIQREMYINGASTSYDVLRAESMWTDALTAYYDAIYMHNVNKARLMRAVGRPIAAAF